MEEHDTAGEDEVQEDAEGRRGGKETEVSARLCVCFMMFNDVRIVVAATFRLLSEYRTEHFCSHTKLSMLSTTGSHLYVGDIFLNF